MRLCVGSGTFSTTSRPTIPPRPPARAGGGIYERAQVLKAFPEAGQRYFASPRDVRILLFGHYRIAYLIKEGGDIDILEVFHGALDIERFNL